jgi:hypothetical protein
MVDTFPEPQRSSPGLPGPPKKKMAKFGIKQFQNTNISNLKNQINAKFSKNFLLNINFEIS